MTEQAKAYQLITVLSQFLTSRLEALLTLVIFNMTGKNCPDAPGYWLDIVGDVCVHAWQLGPAASNAPTYNSDKHAFSILKGKKINSVWCYKLHKQSETKVPISKRHWGGQEEVLKLRLKMQLLKQRKIFDTQLWMNGFILTYFMCCN